jgi:hypothetical protein
LLSGRRRLYSRRTDGGLRRPQTGVTPIFISPAFAQAAAGSAGASDTIVTTGGLIGKITKVVDEAELEVEIAPNVRVRVARGMVADVRAKGEPVKEPA